MRNKSENEGSWFNEYQIVEDYIIRELGDKFIHIENSNCKTASEATINLIKELIECSKQH